MPSDKRLPRDPSGSGEHSNASDRSHPGKPTTMLGCEDVRERLHRYVEGELESVAASFVAAHNETCESCRATLRRLEAERRFTVELLVDAPRLRSSFAKDLMARARQERVEAGSASTRELEAARELEASVPPGVSGLQPSVPEESARVSVLPPCAEREASRRDASPWLAAAAAFLLVAGIAFVLTRPDDDSRQARRPPLREDAASTALLGSSRASAPADVALLSDNARRVAHLPRESRADRELHATPDSTDRVLFTSLGTPSNDSESRDSDALSCEVAGRPTEASGFESSCAIASIPEAAIPEAATSEWAASSERAARNHGSGARAELTRASLPSSGDAEARLPELRGSYPESFGPVYALARRIAPDDHLHVVTSRAETSRGEPSGVASLNDRTRAKRGAGAPYAPTSHERDPCASDWNDDGQTDASDVALALHVLWNSSQPTVTCPRTSEAAPCDEPCL